MTKLGGLLGLLLLSLMALACGGGTVSNGGIRMVSIGGAINDETAPPRPKARFASSGSSNIYSAQAVNLGNPSEVWPVTVYSDETFSTKIVRVTDVKIEVFRSGNLAFSRILSRADTQSSLQTVKINSITHLQAQWISAGHISFEAWDETIARSNVALFGKANLNEAEFHLNSFLSEELSALVAVYGQLFRNTGDMSFGALVEKINAAMFHATATEILSHYKSTMSTLTDLEAQALASAHEGAKNNTAVNSSIAAKVFDDLKASLTGTVLLAFDNALELPHFDSTPVLPRLAGPGILFSYTFPTASTNDILGIERYEGKFSAAMIASGNAPKGLYRNDLDDGRTLNFIPAVGDIGKTYTYEYKVYGANGKSISADNLSVQVGTSSMTALDRKTLSSVPLVGPIVDGNDFFIISSTTADLRKHIELFNVNYILNNGVDLPVSSLRRTLPTVIGNVYDALIHNRILYLATGDKGIYGYDVNYSGNLTSNYPAEYSNSNIKAVQLSLVDDVIFGLQADGNVQRTTLQLSGNTFVPELNAIFASTTEPKISSMDDKILIASSNTQSLPYVLNSAGNLLAMTPYSAPARTPIAEARALKWNPLTYVGSANLSQVSFLGFVVNAGGNTAHQVRTDFPLLANGTYVYSVSSDNLSLRGDAISGNVSSFVEPVSNAPLYFTNCPGTIGFALQQTSSGVSDTHSGGYLFTLGQTTTAGSNTENWSVQAHRIEAQELP